MAEPIDPIQRTSSVPLPTFQTDRGAHNPVPLDAPKELQRVDSEVRDADKDKSTKDFEDYLNQSAIMTLEKAQQDGNRYDPVKEITSASVYSDPGEKSPF